MSEHKDNEGNSKQNQSKDLIDVNLHIETSDKDLFIDLAKENIEGLSFSQRVQILDSVDSLVNVDDIINITVHIVSTVALSVFASWLYEQVVKKKPNKTTINNTNVINNPENITLIINNYAKEGEDN